MRVAIHGTGRMAQAVVNLAADTGDARVTALCARTAPDWETDIPWAGALEDMPEVPDLLIDFTLPAGTQTAALWCASAGVPLVSGVTGLSPEVQSALRRAARVVPVLWAANLSLGVNLLAELAARAAAVLGGSVPVDIEDVHHQWKKDAPSGTALMLGDAIGAERGGAEGIAYHSVREGEVIGDHRIAFHLVGEDIELGHSAHDRSIFAAGALKAGQWLLSQPPGLYSARDWLRRA
ncbi:MAG: 4-hydroxy-tetrahydrodipicolinate reductase [Lysobacterales bacterium]